MRVGATVLLHGLVARPELNGVRGMVVTAADPKTGRCGVRLDDGGSAMALKLSNLTDVAQEATAAVLSDPDLRRAILSRGKRWERSGIHSGVCTQWRSCTWADAEMFRSVVVVDAIPPPPRDSGRGLHRAKPLGARLFMEEGALPLVAKQLAKIPDTSWVEQLFVEQCAAELRIAPVMEAVLVKSFPSLTTLLLSNVDAYCEGKTFNPRRRQYVPSPLHVQKARAEACGNFVSRHLPTLQHLHLTDGINVKLTHPANSLIAANAAILDVGAQPGLRSLQVPGNYPSVDNELIAIKSWPASHRTRLQALHLTDYPELPSLVQMLELLPNLRRLGWNCGGPNRGTFETLAGALATSKVEALYMNIDSSDLYHNDFDAFAQVRSLKELVVCCDSCDIRRDDDDDGHIDDGLSEDPSYADVTSRLCQVMGGADDDDDDHHHHRGAAVLICDCCDLSHPLDPLHRVLLPTSEEEWHLEPNARGLEHLDFLSAGEITQVLHRVRNLNALWLGLQVQAQEPQEQAQEPQKRQLPGEVYDAAFAGEVAAVEAWLDGGGHADALLVDDNDGMLLSAAASGGRDSMIEMLLRRGATVDVQNKIGWNSLMAATFEGHIGVVRLLLQARAKPDLQNTNRNTALTIARQRAAHVPARSQSFLEIIRLLQESGAGASEEPTGFGQQQLAEMFAQIGANSAFMQM